MICPRCIMISRSPRLAACCIECVTISVVSLSRATTCSVRAIRMSALFGSRAAVCSSRSSSSGRSHVAISRVSAWRCPPDRLPIAFSKRCSSPMLSRLTSSRIFSTSEDFRPQPRPRARPRRAARLRFSRMLRLGEVPLKGFWKTRPTNFARAYSGQAVTSLPAMRMLPSSTKNVPATALRKVDLPEPLLPMMITQDPGSSLRLTQRSERTSLGVPPLKLLAMAWTSSMRAPQPRLAQKLRHDEGEKHKHCGDKFQVVGTEPPTQRDRNHQPEKNRAHHRADERQAHLVAANQRFADDDARQSPHHHADAHSDVGKSLILREQRAGERHQSIGDGQTENDHRAVVHAQRANHVHVVSRGAHGHAEVGAQKK